MVKRILAVDPDATDRLIAKKVLGDDYHVVVFSSEKEALTFARWNEFDIAIINSKLINHNDGISLLQQLQRINPNFLPIATTALHESDIDLTLKHSGFNNVVQKPLTGMEVKEIINQQR